MMNNAPPCDLTRLFYASTTHTHTHTMIDKRCFILVTSFCEFFSTIKYLGGEGTRKFVRGPGFLLTGRGGEKKIESFADFNRCGPSLNAIKRCQSGYPTESETMKPHLLSLFSLCQHPKADLRAIVDTKKVRVIPVSLASYGTVLKPGLEYDPRQKQVIGLTDKMDEKFVKKHPLPDPKKIKTNLITSADVTIATSLDNGAAMPVAVFFRPKSVTGEEIFSCMKDSIRTVQTRENCLKVQLSVKHFVSSETSYCLAMSKCEECLSSKSVCTTCKYNGQVFQKVEFDRPGERSPE